MASRSPLVMEPEFTTLKLDSKFVSKAFSPLTVFPTLSDILVFPIIPEPHNYLSNITTTFA